MKKIIPIFVAITFSYVLKGYYFLDPDFGWHLKMGEYIRRAGIPKTDPFSYTMASYPFVDHEWASNVILSFVFSFFGQAGLLFLFSLFGLWVLILYTERIEHKLRGGMVLIYGIILLSFFGIRIQVVSWVYCLLAVTWVMKYGRKKGAILIFPALLFVWSNTHGSFPLGIGVLFIFYVTTYIKTRRVNIIDGFVFILSVLVTFLPPYGLQRWWEVWMQLSDAGLRWSIQEWSPLFFKGIDLALIGYMALSLALFIKYFNKIDLFLKTLYLLFLCMALGSIRHVPLWVGVSSVVLAKTIHCFMIEIKKVEIKETVIKFFQRYVFLFFLVQTLFILVLFYAKKNIIQYPDRAVSFLRKNPIPGNMFNSYEWGGYLIWQYPQKKVFIDGRMPSWRWNSQKKNESDNAFQEWQDIMAGKIKIQRIQKKYNITHILTATTESMYLCKKFKNIGGTKSKNPLTDLKVFYQDKVATIYLLD